VVLLIVANPQTA